MSQPNIKFVVGKKNKKKKRIANKNVPTTNPFWSQITKPNPPANTVFIIHHNRESLMQNQSNPQPTKITTVHVPVVENVVDTPTEVPCTSQPVQAGPKPGTEWKKPNLNQQKPTTRQSKKTQKWLQFYAKLKVNMEQKRAKKAAAAAAAKAAGNPLNSAQESANEGQSSENTQPTSSTTQDTKTTMNATAGTNQQAAAPVLKSADPPQQINAPQVAQQPNPSNIYKTVFRKRHPTAKQRNLACQEILGFNYPTGIPKSFIMQQLSQEASVTMASNSPIYPMGHAIIKNQQPNMAQQTFGQPSMNSGSNEATGPIFVKTDNTTDVQQPYSPSDIYAESGNNQEPIEEDELDDATQTGQKRLSAFQRLGPLSQPKKPKLTINLTLNKEQPVREVVDDTDCDPDRYTPVHLRQNIINSTDETVSKYLPNWPWKKNFGIRRSATARSSKSVMIMEQELMEEAYEKDNLFIHISVKGYPSSWTKERVLDTILDSVKGYSLIPCFTEFYENECKFLTLRNRSALIIIHKTGFYIHKDGVELTITISQANLTLNQIDFIPRLILRKRIGMGYDAVANKLNLSAFTLQEDISHFIYFPLSRASNQSELIQLQSVIAWDKLTSLDLSRNRLTNLTGLDLKTTTPKLQHLDLSHNCLDKVTAVLGFRDLPLKSINLEGNPLCHDYIQPEHYIKVLKMMFSALVKIDGVKINFKGDLPESKQNYCPEEAMEVTEKFLEVYFPLLDSASEHRSLIQGMYEDDATLTITYCYKLRYGPIYRSFRNLFLYARFLDEGETDSVVGAMAITKLINRWPQTEHDPSTFTVDVMFHDESTTILRISGILKLTAETLAEDEHLLSFTRTVVLHSDDGAEYKIQNEMVYWAEPTASQARSAFRVTTVSQKNTNLKIESTTDEDLQEKLLIIFMKLTTMDKKICKRCLEMNSWNFKLALEHFTKLLKSNSLDSLTKETVTV